MNWSWEACETTMGPLPVWAFAAAGRGLAGQDKGRRRQARHHCSGQEGGRAKTGKPADSKVRGEARSGRAVGRAAAGLARPLGQGLRRPLLRQPIDKGRSHPSWGLSMRCLLDNSGRLCGLASLPRACPCTASAPRREAAGTWRAHRGMRAALGARRSGAQCALQRLVPVEQARCSTCW